MKPKNTFQNSRIQPLIMLRDQIEFKFYTIQNFKTKKLFALVQFRKTSTWTTLRSIVQAHDFTSLASDKNSTTDNVAGSNRRGTMSRGRLRRIAFQVKLFFF